MPHATHRVASLLPLLCLLQQPLAARANVMSDHSFLGPYRSVDAEGNRLVENWAAGGSTEVTEHFVRLTNDRQSKKGWLWSTRNWNYLEQWTITLRLRVSGQGRRLFGDGACVRACAVVARAAGCSGDVAQRPLAPTPPQPDTCRE